MRAILLLLIGAAAACGGGTEANTFELGIAVDAPEAAAALVDDTQQIAAVGGIYVRGFTSVNAAASVHGKVATIDANGSVRAEAPYELGSYCTAQMPLIRQTMHYVEASDANGNPALTLDTIECEKSNGTGVIVTP